MIVIVLIVFVCMVYWHTATNRPKLYPPGPKWLPIVGNSVMLRRAAKEHGSLIAAYRAWKDEYQSDLLGLKLGNELVVVALTYPILQEVITNSALDARPDNFFLRLRTMGSRLGITCTGNFDLIHCFPVNTSIITMCTDFTFNSADGTLWSEQRNFVSCHLRRSGYGRMRMLEQIQGQLNEMLDVITDYDEQPVWPGSFLALSVINVLWTFTAGKQMTRCDDQLKRLLELMKERSKAFDMSGGWLNAMPFLRFIAPEQTSYNLIKRFNTELYQFFMPIIEDHKRRFSADKVDEDLIFAFINEMNQATDKNTNFTETQLVMIILDLFIAGAQSTSNTLDFMLMSMALNPSIQEKCHQVIDNVLGNTQLLSLSDKSKLAYIEAVIFETQRFYSIASMTGPRRVLQETTLDGYVLPKNTTVLIALETIHMDVNYWHDPHTFRPERFLDENNNIINTERLVPFGQGRRRCLGEALARACLFSYTVGILQKFRIEIPAGAKISEKDTVPGLLTSPVPYEVIFKSRKL